MASTAILKVKKMGTNFTDTYMELPYEDLVVDLVPKTFTLSGLSSGSFTTANILAMFNTHKQIDGAAMVIGGGPCATRGYCPNPQIIPDKFDYDKFNPETDKIPEYTSHFTQLKNVKQYPTDGLKDMKLYFYSGSLDTIVPPDKQDD